MSVDNPCYGCRMKNAKEYFKRTKDGHVLCGRELLCDDCKKYYKGRGFDLKKVE